MQIKKKVESRVSESGKCSCSKATGLFIKSQQLSRYVAAAILILFFTFIIGFFGGQRYAIQQFSNKIDNDSFADQIYASLCAISDQDLDSQDSCESYPEDVDQKDQDDSEIANKHAQLNEAPTSLEEPAAVDAATYKTDDAQEYYAELIGFGTSQAAHRFTHQLIKKGFPAEVKKRQSKTSRGKPIYWYQVVTDLYQDKEKLTALVDRITKEEKLSGVRIVTV
jgi:hypothetical protein